MSKDWREVKEKIEKDLDRIMWEEPDEIKMSRLGIFPSGAGHDGQVFGNMVFQLADTNALGWGKTRPVISVLIQDPDFSLEHCKKMWTATNVHACRILGEMDPPKCPYPWLNLGKLWKFCQGIIESFDSIKTKDEFADLVWSWFNYIDRVNMWLYFTFPWEIGYMFPRKDSEKVKDYAKLLNLKVKKIENKL